MRLQKAAGLYLTPSRLPCYVICTCMLTKRKFGNQPLDAQQRDNFAECSWLTLDIMGYGGQGGLAIYGVNADTEKLLKVKQHYIFSPFNPNKTQGLNGLICLLKAPIQKYIFKHSAYFVCLPFCNTIYVEFTVFCMSG